MTFLTPHLPFSTSSPLPPPSSHLSVSDTLSAPGDFAVYHLVAAAISKKIKIVWVDFRGTGRASWEAVLRKLGTSLPSTFVHITPSSLPFSSFTQSSSPQTFDETDNPTLKPTYTSLVPHITPDSLIILDGLSELEYLGFSPAEIGRFVRSILPPILATGSRLITTLHADHLSLTSSGQVLDEGDLLDRLLRLGNGWWRIGGLQTGRSADVHGEISAHSLLPTSPDGESTFPSVPKGKPLQYRLETGGVKMFPKGTGRGYL